MSQEYASKQPQGYKNHIEKVAVVGAGGHVGTYIVEQLLKTGKHKVTAISREGSQSKMPEGVEVKHVNYDDQSSLVNALQGQDALVITMNIMAPPDQQDKLIDAAAAAHVKWIFPNEFGVDPENIELKTALGMDKTKVRERVEKAGCNWVAIVCSFWYEWSLSIGSQWYGFDFHNNEVTFFDDGKTAINTTTWPQTGRSIAHLVSLPILPQDEHDKSTVLSQFKNKSVYISSFLVSQKDMFDSVLRVTGAKESDWKISYEPSNERVEAGKKELAAGDMRGRAKMLYGRSFYPSNPSEYEAKVQNALIGLPKEDLDEYTKISVDMAKRNAISLDFFLPQK